MPRFKYTDRHLQNIIDEDTGIEILEKNGEKRVRNYVMTGEDLSPALTFIFRDPHDRNSLGTEIEFEAKRLWDRYEKVGLHMVVEGWFGLEIDLHAFNDRFRRYSARDEKRLAQVRQFITAALLFLLSSRKDSVVRFI